MRAKHRLFLKSFFLTLITLLLVFVLSFIVFFENSQFFNITPANETVQTPKGEQLTILLTTRTDDNSPPDFYTLLTFNPQNSTVSTVTFPNNAAVYMEKKTTTFSESYSYAGAQKTVDSLNETYKMNIQYYLDLTYDELGQLTGLFDAFPYNVFENIEEKQNGKTVFKLQSGEQMLNGVQAAGLIRYCSLPYEEKVVLLNDLSKTFFMQNMKKEHLENLAKKLDEQLENKKTSLSTVGTQKLQSVLERFHFDDIKLVAPTVTGVTEDGIFYFDDSTMGVLNGIYKD